MKKDNERKTVVRVGEKVTRVNIVENETAVEIFSSSNRKDNQQKNIQSNVSVSEDYIETYFPIVKASTLSVEDTFLRNEPETRKQCQFKALLTAAIESGLTDFRAPIMDPTFTNSEMVIFEAGKMPAIGKSPNWWKENAVKILPEKGSRLGTRKERIAFLGLLIKYLVDEENYTVSDAWKAVCDQSKELGHYWDSEDAKHDFEPTGSRKIGQWYDLANTYKITIGNDSSDFLLEGSYYNCNGNSFPLVSASKISYPLNLYWGSVGWIVLNV